MSISSDDVELPWQRMVPCQPGDYPHLQRLLQGLTGDAVDDWEAGKVPLRHRLNLQRYDAVAAKLLELNAQPDSREDDQDELDAEAYENFRALDFETAEDQITDGAFLLDFLEDVYQDWDLTNSPEDHFTLGQQCGQWRAPVEASLQLPDTVGELRALLAMFSDDQPIVHEGGYPVYLNAMRFDRWVSLLVADDSAHGATEVDREEFTAVVQGAPASKQG